MKTLSLASLQNRIESNLPLIKFYLDYDPSEPEGHRWAAVMRSDQNEAWGTGDTIESAINNSLILFEVKNAK